MEQAVVYEKQPPRRSRMPAFCRTLVFFWAAGAIVLSVFSIYSCEFFSYRALDGEPWEGLSPPFDDLAKASVGLFRYSETTNSAGIVGEECIDYEDWKDVGQRSYFIVAQSCSMAAPAIAFLALVQILFECCLCRLRGSYICIRFFFFVAGLLQGCSFFIFAETQFCLDAASQNQCSLKKGGIYSMSATAAYLVIAIASIAMRPYKDESGGCGISCCMISTRMSAVSRLEGDDHDDDDHDAASTTKKAVEGDTSEDGEDTKYEDEETPAEDDQMFLDHYDISRTTMSDAGPTVDEDGEDKYSQANFDDKLMADDTEFISNSEAKLDEELMADDSEFISNSGNALGDALLSTSDEEVTAEGDGNSTIEPMPNDDKIVVQDDVDAQAQAQAQEAAEVVEAPEETEHSRSPDFLDMCCGDPLELEKYMSGSATTTTTTTTKDKKFERNRSKSLRTSLRKIEVMQS